MTAPIASHTRRHPGCPSSWPPQPSESNRSLHRHREPGLRPGQPGVLAGLVPHTASPLTGPLCRAARLRSPAPRPAREAGPPGMPRASARSPAGARSRPSCGHRAAKSTSFRSSSSKKNTRSRSACDGGPAYRPYATASSSVRNSTGIDRTVGANQAVLTRSHQTVTRTCTDNRPASERPWAVTRRDSARSSPWPFHCGRTPVCWRMSSRWREENLLPLRPDPVRPGRPGRLRRRPDDPDRMVPNPARKTAAARVRQAEAAAQAAETARDAALLQLRSPAPGQAAYLDQADDQRPGRPGRSRLPGAGASRADRGLPSRPGSRSAPWPRT